MKTSSSSAIDGTTNSTPPHSTSSKPFGSQPGWGNASVPPWASEPERAMNDVARREQFLAVQLKAHRLCAAQLAEDRARFEAERAAATARAAEDAAARMREELAAERQAFERKKMTEGAELERRQAELVRREAELGL